MYLLYLDIYVARHLYSLSHGMMDLPKHEFPYPPGFACRTCIVCLDFPFAKLQNFHVKHQAHRHPAADILEFFSYFI